MNGLTGNGSRLVSFVEAPLAFMGFAGRFVCFAAEDFGRRSSRTAGPSSRALRRVGLEEYRVVARRMAPTLSR
jgi:hypothetical protein